jgi:hypothetical protein
MGLLTGPASITRFNLPVSPEEPSFEEAAFTEIAPGSELRESAGFVPMEPDAPYEVGTRRHAFRVRIDKLRPDPTAVGERLKQLIRTELDMSGAAFVGPKKKRQLKQLAEEELILRATPRSKIIECCIDGNLLYVASTAKAFLGHVTELLRRIGVTAELKTPWLDRDDPDFESEIVTPKEPGESVLGCRFLKALVEDREVMIEGESGNVRLKTAEARVNLAGAVLPHLHRYLDRGAEILAAKLITADSHFRFEAMTWRVSGLRVETDRHEHWTELLDERIEKIAGVFDLLDRKYEELAPEFLKP